MLRARRRGPIDFGANDPVPIPHAPVALGERCRAGQDGGCGRSNGCAGEQDWRKESHSDLLSQLFRLGTRSPCVCGGDLKFSGRDGILEAPKNTVQQHTTEDRMLEVIHISKRYVKHAAVVRGVNPGDWFHGVLPFHSWGSFPRS